MKLTKQKTTSEVTKTKNEDKNDGREKVEGCESVGRLFRLVGWSKDNIFIGLTMQISTETLDFTDNSVLIFCEFTWIQV